MKIAKITILLLLLFSCLCFSAENSPASDRGSKKGVLRSLSLPKPSEQGQYSLEQTIKHNQSFDKFTVEPLKIDLISQLLWSAYPQVDPNTTNLEINNSLNAFELYVIIRGGIYKYSPQSHLLEKLIDGDMRRKLSSAAGNIELLEKSPCSIIIAGSDKPFLKEFSSEAKKVLFFEAGKIAQNIQLQALSLELGSYPVMSFDAGKVKPLFQMSVDVDPLHILAVGYPVKKQRIQMLKFDESSKKDDDQQLPEPKKYRAVIVVPDGIFIDKELFDTIDALSIAGIESDIAGVAIKTFRSEDKGRIDTTLLIGNINMENYDAIVVISGQRTRTLYKNTPIYRILREAADQDKVIAAVGKATRVLAEARIVKGYNVTGERSSRSILKKAGAKFTNAEAQRDDNIVTGVGDEYTIQFARMLVEAITGRVSRLGKDGRYVSSKVLERQDKNEDETQKRRTRR